MGEVVDIVVMCCDMYMHGLPLQHSTCCLQAIKPKTYCNPSTHSY